MKKSILFISFLFLNVFLNAQKDSSEIYRTKNSLFIEFGGNAIEPNNGWQDPGEHFSINYDHLLHIGKSVKTSFRVGTNLPFQNFGSGSGTHIMLAMLNLLIGKRNFNWELGAGGELIFVNSNYKKAYSAFTTVLGLRYQKDKIIARIGLTPTLGIVAHSLYASSLMGISIGYNF